MINGREYIMLLCKTRVYELQKLSKKKKLVCKHKRDISRNWHKRLDSNYSHLETHFLF